ncbi:DUF4397 domain-containing protein [Myxococcus sp. K38C18041901]|uniref:DUF4397 domain-containing protein n=1 Tax=Myxococcus guangdongensis TaxID=2906760 RepID=UPI0020A73C9D|nr:DUF4397 domain-containing protein [Myxococcus guangdongensis]MCP3064648.1 DUF4397 domain-containing protein [Myxococcus guangdongensis]
MKRNVLGSWLLMVGLALAAGVTGCGDDEGPSDAGSVARCDGGRVLADGGCGEPLPPKPCDGGPVLPDGGCGLPPTNPCDGGPVLPDGGCGMPPTNTCDGGPVLPDGGCGEPPTNTCDGGPVLPDGGCGGPPTNTCDGGPASPDGGCGEPPPTYRAHVRFINAFVGFKGNPADTVDKLWDPFRVTLRVDDVEFFRSMRAGAAAVSEFREVLLTGPTQSMRMVARDAEGTSEAPDLVVPVDISLADGDWVTVVGAGSLLQVGQARPDHPRLVVLRDNALAAAAPEGEVRVRFMSADRVVSATAKRRFADETGRPYDDNSVDPYSADPVEQGFLVPSKTPRVAIIGTSPTFAPAQSGWLFYSLPEGTFEDGKAYYAINTGEDRRTLSDEASPALLIVTAKQDAFARFQRGPLVYFFHGLLPAAGGGTQQSLQVIRGSSNIAASLAYGTAPKVADLPVSDTGFPLRVTVNGQPGQAVLEGATTGPLEAGRRYLGVLCGRIAGAPTLTLVKDEFATESAQSPFLRFIPCSANSPSPLDFGAYSFQADGSSRDVFTPLFTGATLATPTLPVTGVSFTPPVSTTMPAYTWLGLKTQETTPLERTIRGRVLTTPSFLILIGEWESSLSYRVINTRVNTWSVSSPNDASFSPLPAP